MSHESRKNVHGLAKVASICLAIGLASALFTTIFYIRHGVPTPPPASFSSLGTPPKDLVALLKQNGIDIGPAVIEFSDFECPFCRQQETTYRGLPAKIGHSLQICTFNFPLQMHPFARRAALASIAAHNLGIGKLFDAFLFTSTNLSKQAMIERANLLGVGKHRFETEMSSPQVKAQLKAQIDVAHRLGVEATPSFFLLSQSGKLFRMQNLKDVPFAYYR